jgi:hypothetical protein
MSARRLFEFEQNASEHLWVFDEVSWVDDGFGGWDESGDLSHLDRYLEKKRKEQAKLEEDD